MPCGQTKPKKEGGGKKKGNEPGGLPGQGHDQPSLLGLPNHPHNLQTFPWA